MSRAGRPAFSLAPTRLLVLLLLCVAVPAAAQRASVPSGAGSIRGTLVNAETGAGLYGEPIALMWIPPESTRAYPYPWTPMDGSRRPRPVAQTTTDAAGVFEFANLGGGLYELKSDLPLDGEIPIFDVQDGAVSHAVLSAQLGRIVTGRVLRPDGTPASGAEVFLAGVEDGTGGNALWERDPVGRPVRDDGTFLLPDLPEGRCWLEAWHEDLGFSAPVPADDSSELRLVLREESGRLFPLDEPKFGGVGISVSRDAAGPIVASVREGGPAGRVGVTAGDRIAEVDGMPTLWMPFVELLMRCRGPAGRPVILTLLRGEERLEVEIVREIFE